MATVFNTPNERAEPPTPSVDIEGSSIAEPVRYLTNGTALYRCLGTVVDGGEEMIGLEDCHSLTILLVSGAEFTEMALRAVVPA